MKRSLLTVVILIGALFALSAALPRTSFESLAQEVVDACASSSDPAGCYEREVPALYPELSIPDVFDVVRSIRAKDPSYQFCHVLAHKLGESVVAQDPARWLDAFVLNPADGLCSNGFLHGVVGGRFRAEVLDDETLDTLVPDFSIACLPRGAWSPSDLDSAICIHGMGHLYDFITDADLPKALELCERTTSEQFRRVCIEGVFMQIYQPLEPDDFLMIERMTVKPSTTTVRHYCARFSKPAHEGACLRESWPFFRQEITEGYGVERFCSGQPNDREETHCYESATAIIGRMSLGDQERAAASCDALPASRRTLCYTSVARTIIEENRDDASSVVRMCERGGAVVGDACLLQLAQEVWYLFGNDTERARAFCVALPETHRSSCKI